VTPSRFVASLAEMRLPSVFNPYADYCNVCDRADAAKLRKKNLLLFLEAALESKVDTIWVARDLGYRGGRRTGVPLTDEIHLDAVGQLLGGLSLKQATRGPAMAERTAAVVWKVLSAIGQPAVLWNVFPFHPHETNDPFSNRCHTAGERKQTLPLLQGLISMFKPQRLVAIGRDAQLALADMQLPIVTVRHPSYGGQNEFMASLYELYGVSGREEKPRMLPTSPRPLPVRKRKPQSVERHPSGTSSAHRQRRVSK
jgi:uracil-DNA glycosylase